MRRTASISMLIALGMFLCIRTSAASGTASYEAAQRLAIEGLDCAFNLDVAAANVKFDQAIAADPAFTPAYLFRTLPMLWKILANRSQTDRDSFMLESDRIISVAENRLDSNPHDPDALYTIGMTHLYRASVYGRFDSYLKAAWDAKKGYGYLEDCLEANPQMSDAYIGLGAIHYIVGTLPKTLRWMLSIVGVESNTQKGIVEMQIAAEKAYYVKPEARFYLGMYYAYLEEEQRGVDMLTALVKQYPGNIIFLYNLAGAEMRQKRILQAREYYTRVIDTHHRDYSIMTVYSVYRLGECALRQNNFAEAKKWYTQFLEQTPAPQFRAVAYWRIGQCCEALGDRKGGLDAYGRAAAIETKHQEDRAAIRRSQEAMRRQMKPAEFALLKADNMYYTGDFPGVVAAYQQALKRTDLTDDEKGEIYHGLGRVYIDMNRLDDAAKMLNKIFGLTIRSETWIQPWARYYMAVIAQARGDKDLARQYLDLALSADNYDYKMWLTFKAERLEERLH